MRFHLETAVMIIWLDFATIYLSFMSQGLNDFFLVFCHVFGFSKIAAHRTGHFNEEFIYIDLFGSFGEI